MNFLSYSDWKRMLIREQVRQPTYVAVKPDLESRESLVELAEVIGLSNSLLVPEDKMHCTVAYSRDPIDDPSTIVQTFLPATATGDDFDMFGPEKKTLVLKLSSVSLRALHVSLRNLGASHDYPTFEPHVTLCYEVPEGFKMPTKKPKLGLKFTTFEVKPLDED